MVLMYWAALDSDSPLAELSVISRQQAHVGMGMFLNGDSPDASNYILCSCEMGKSLNVAALTRNLNSFVVPEPVLGLKDLGVI